MLIRGVIAHGTGTSSLEGHATSPLEHVVIDGLELHMTCDPAAPYERTAHALALRHARDVALRNVKVFWEAPGSTRWRSALAAEDVQGLRLENFAARQAPSAVDAAAIALEDVTDALLRNCIALPGTTEFVHVSGAASARIQLLTNDLRAARIPWQVEGTPAVLQSSGDLLRAP